MADYNSAYTGQEIDAGIAKANAAVPGSRKVNGKALSSDVTLSAADVGALPTSGGTMTGSIKMGEHDITGTGTNYGLFFDSMGQVIVKAGDSNSVEVTDMGVTIRSDVGITLDGSVSGISKSSVGLGNVDNTSDANKPISTATQTALNGKANTSHTHAAGDITSGTLPASRGGTGYTSLSSLMSAINNRSTNVSSANTSYTTLMARGAKLVSSDTSPGVNGAISWTYG